MAAITRDTNGVSFDAISLDNAPQLTVIAGVAIAAGQFCYVDSTGKAQLTDATSANAPVDGIAVEGAAVGNPITLAGVGAKLHYAAASGITPGSTLYLDVTARAGGLSTVATTGDAIGVAKSYTDMDIRVTRMA